MTDSVRDVTPLVDLTQEFEAGLRRCRRPAYVDLMPPCSDACPAGERVQGWPGRGKLENPAGFNAKSPNSSYAASKVCHEGANNVQEVSQIWLLRTQRTAELKAGPRQENREC